MGYTVFEVYRVKHLCAEVPGVARGISKVIQRSTENDLLHWKDETVKPVQGAKGIIFFFYVLQFGRHIIINLTLFLINIMHLFPNLIISPPLPSFLVILPSQHTIRFQDQRTSLKNMFLRRKGSDYIYITTNKTFQFFSLIFQVLNNWSRIFPSLKYKVYEIRFQNYKCM